MPRRPRTPDEPPSPGSVFVCGEKVRSKRAELNWTQEDLAAKSGLSKGTISSIENGQATLVHNVHCAAAALGMSYDDIALPAHNVSHIVSEAAKEPLAQAGLLVRRPSEREMDAVQVQQLIQRLMEVTGSNGPIVVTSVKGTPNALVTISIPQSHLDGLVEAFADTKLDTTQVSAIVLSNPALFATPTAGPSLDVGPSLSPFGTLFRVGKWLFDSMSTPSFAVGSDAYRNLQSRVQRDPPTVDIEVQGDQRAILCRRAAIA